MWCTLPCALPYHRQQVLILLGVSVGRVYGWLCATSRFRGLRSKLCNLLENQNVPWGKVTIDIPRGDDAAAATEGITKQISFYIRCFTCRPSQAQRAHCIGLISGRCEVSMSICKAGMEKNGKLLLSTSQQRKKAASCGFI